MTKTTKQIEQTAIALGLLDREESRRLAASSPELCFGARDLAMELAPLADAVTPVIPSARLRERVLAMATPRGRFDGLLDRLQRLLRLPEPRLRELLEAADEPGVAPWMEGPAPGIRWLFFETGPACRAAHGAFVSCAPGVRFPEHRHVSDEWALVVDGAALDSSGDEWAVGDLVHFPAGSSHFFTTGEDRLLAMVLSDDPVAFVDPTRSAG